MNNEVSHEVSLKLNSGPSLNLTDDNTHCMTLSHHSLGVIQTNAQEMCNDVMVLIANCKNTQYVTPTHRVRKSPTKNVKAHINRAIYCHRESV